MNKWSRRGLLTAGVLTGGALVVGVAIRPGNRVAKLQPLAAKGDEILVNTWIKIAPDNRITAIVPHAEMGQGVFTALGAMLADELDADWDKLTVEAAPVHAEYANHVIPRFFLLPGARPPGIVEDTIDGAFLTIAKSMKFQTTGGSMSVRGTGEHGLRIAGAATRQMLMEATAVKWDVPVSELRTDKSFVFHDRSKRSEPYASFAAEAAEHMPPAHPTLKKPSEYGLMGKPLPRIDIPSKVDGTAKFGIDAVIPGMKYAVVKAPPVWGSKIAKMDADAARKMPGVISVLNMGDFAAVVADQYWQAKKALDAVSLTYTKTDADKVSSASIFAQQAAALDSAQKGESGDADRELGDSVAALSSAKQTIEAEYRVPYLAHATMEPMTCAAWAHDGICEIWAGMQNPLGSRAAVAAALKLEPDNVKIYNQFLGGGFGRRGRPDFTNQAALISAATKIPVKLIWSREEDITHDHYRPAVTSRFKGGLDASGNPVAWINHYLERHDPKEAALIPYAIPNQYIGYTEAKTHVPFGAWRSVDHSQHGFFAESFIDELAHAAGKDPYQFRRALLKDSPRHVAVLDAATKMSGWGEPLPAGQGRGVALVEAFGTIVAQVALVEIVDGKARVRQVWCAADAGFAVNPNGFEAQMEGGIIYGLTAALYGEITIENGSVVQSNFQDYEMIRMSDAPAISVQIINSGATVGGAGEPGTPPIAPAVTNAIFAVTGKRIRELPVKKAGTLVAA